MFRRAAAVLLAASAAALPGCGEDLVSDFVAVPARPPEATPVSAFRSTLGEAALSLSFIGPLIESDGSVNAFFSDGSHLTGFVDVQTGEFDLLLELPNGYYLVEVSDIGRFDLDGGYIVGASYREEYRYISGAEARWDVEFDFQGNGMDLDARDVDRDTRVHCDGRFFSGRILLDETWDLENGYHEDISTVYQNVDPYVEQDWVRDEHATAVGPDRSGHFEFAEDGSGEGRFEWYYDHGITSVYEILYEADGDATATLVYEDPGTAVSPDGEGSYAFEQDYSGTGQYTERYDDGSVLTADDVYYSNDSFDETFAFDDASTTWSPDADGESQTAADGSGTGVWRRYDADGVAETCEYEYDSAGVIGDIDCT